MLIIIGSLFLGASCDKTNNYPKNSVIGPWRCIEQGAYYNFRQYNVAIELQAKDSSEIVILNLYNAGFDVETFATINDTIITLWDSNYPGIHDFTGLGYIERDFSAIYWEFSYNGPSVYDPLVEAKFVRP